MSKMKQDRILGNPKVLAGPEIETLADYLGQGALGVQFYNPSTELTKFHPISGAYNDIIAQAVDKKNKLCMSTDSNRSQEKLLFPRRTSIRVSLKSRTRKYQRVTPFS